MDTQVLAALVKLIEIGGTWAVWGILAYYGIHLLEVIVIGAFSFLAIKAMVTVMFKK